MPFRLADVKKIVRKRSDGERYLHPQLLEGVGALTQVSLALAYFNNRLGRRRSDFDTETLVQIFGDARLARGVVSCLAATYQWRNHTFAEVLEAQNVARLLSRGIATSSDLRLHLFDAVNASGSGFLAGARGEALQPLARRLRLTPAKLDQLVALDADENAVLVRVREVPTPAQIVAQYSFAVIDAIVRHSSHLELRRLTADERSILAARCADHGVPLTWAGTDARLHNVADSFGSYARTGFRLSRSLYIALSSAPGLARDAAALVRLPASHALYKPDKTFRDTVTGGTGRILVAGPLPDLRQEWERLRAQRGVAGWRLVSSGEPTLTRAGLVVPAFSCQRGDERVMLWPVSNAEQGAHLEVLQQAGIATLPITPGDGAATIVAALSDRWGGDRVDAAGQAVEALVGEAAARGFIPEAEVLSALNYATPAEAATRLRDLPADHGTYIAGLGLCSPDFVATMRRGLRRAQRRSSAA